MVALINLLHKEYDAIREIERLESLRQRRREAIEWYHTNCEDIGIRPLLINDCLEQIDEFDKEIHANHLIVEAVRNEILAYFASIKEELHER